MIIIVTTVACFTCGVIGYFVGWITTVDRQERRAEPASAEPPRPSTFPAQEAEDFWAGVKWDGGSHARTSPRVTAGFPALPAAVPALEQRPVQAPRPGDPPSENGAVRVGATQPPLRELVHAGRTTDVIEKMRADTDRWLAARGLEEA